MIARDFSEELAEQALTIPKRTRAGTKPRRHFSIAKTVA